MSNNRNLIALIVYVLIASLLLAGCSGAAGAQSGTNYLYTYKMTQPVVNDQLMFKDNYIIIQFSFDQSAVSFQLQNVSQASMSIVWEKVSLGVNKRIYSVRNTSNFYSMTSAPPIPTVIPPLGYIRETMIPRDNIFMDKDQWVEKDLFLSNDRNNAKLKKAITGYVGGEITLSIPVKIGEIVTDYAFTFNVSKVTPLPSKLLPPVKERPAAPKSPVMESSSGSNIVPIAIAAGVLGVAVYLLSQKKTPAADL
ncbi:MAG: hypothetical protein ACOYNS_08195 [Bacteroidota bacterium]